eukprot:Gregarina_sp_Poly_1__6275@NODE_332_length_9468_cov_135_874162_g280_i0_p3_GENE_NODE_332_length_9468_cov_135_874162_g280_i0NODE_332_length_9468_cov_135_874162_g280_i0_p3_ORF_typecomplete_len297_score34_22NUDIX_2/PF13869_6/1_5e32_NODE_332_length_9468_cov_135_874162_g280_i01271017
MKGGELPSEEQLRDPEWKLYPQQGYEVVTDDTLKPVSLCPPWNYTQRNSSFFRKGMRHTAAAVMITHRWLTPHLLVFLKQAEPNSANQKLHCGLFSVKYSATENPRQILIERLNSYLKPTSVNMMAQSAGGETLSCRASVGDYLGTWWMASSNDYNHPLPYIPAHTTRPREMIRLYQIILPPEVTFCVTPGYTLKSIPLFDLVTHRPPLPSAMQKIPFMLARFIFTYFEAGEDDEALGRSIHGSGSTRTAGSAPATVPAPTPKSAHEVEAAQRSQVQLLVERLKDDPPAPGQGYAY